MHEYNQEKRRILRRYIEMSLKLADMLETMDKAEADRLCLKGCSCGCRVVPNTLREGVAELVNLMTEYQYKCDLNELNTDDAQSARDFINEIFGYEFVDELDAGIIAALKAKLKPLNLPEEVDRLCNNYNDGK